MALPANIPGLGSSESKPLVNRQFDPAGSALTPEDYFVLTRIDGRTSLKQIVQICGFPEAHALTILARLREAGAFYFQGETPPAPKPRPAPVPPPSGSGAVASPAAAMRSGPVIRPTVRGELKLDPAALAEKVDLADDQKKQILTKHALVQGANLFEILEVDPDADKRAVKRAYFRISKDFHPDRFYGKSLGNYQQRLAEIFKAATEAFEILSDDGKRELYTERLVEAQAAAAPAVDPNAPQAVQHQPSTRMRLSAADREYAAKLFEQACQHQVTGEVELALREFAEVVRRDPSPKYLRRAAEATLRAGDYRGAEEYVKKATEIDPRDALARRMLAKVFRASGRPDDAIRELELASKLDPESAHIASELEELRKQRPNRDG